MDSATLQNIEVNIESDMTFANLVEVFVGIINDALIPLLMAVTIAVIVWKVVDTFVLHADDEQKRVDGRRFILIGVLVMALFVTIWSVLAFVRTGILGG